MGNQLNLRKEEDKIKIQELLARGMTSPNSIADVINQHRVGLDVLGLEYVIRIIKDIKGDLKIRYDKTADEYRNEILAGYDYLAQVAMESFHESKNSVTTTIEYDEIVSEEEYRNMSDSPPDIPYDESLFLRKAKIKQTKTPKGDHNFLNQFANALHKKSVLVGANAPTKIAHTDADGKDKMSALEKLQGQLDSLNKNKPKELQEQELKEDSVDGEIIDVVEEKESNDTNS